MMTDGYIDDRGHKTISHSPNLGDSRCLLLSSDMVEGCLRLPLISNSILPHIQHHLRQLKYLNIEGLQS